MDGASRQHVQYAQPSGSKWGSSLEQVQHVPLHHQRHSEHRQERQRSTLQLKVEGNVSIRCVDTTPVALLVTIQSPTKRRLFGLPLYHPSSTERRAPTLTSIRIPFRRISGQGGTTCLTVCLVVTTDDFGWKRPVPRRYRPTDPTDRSRQERRDRRSVPHLPPSLLCVVFRSQPSGPHNEGTPMGRGRQQGRRVPVLSSQGARTGQYLPPTTRTAVRFGS